MKIRQIIKTMLNKWFALIGICIQQVAISEPLVVDPTQPISGWEKLAGSGSAAIEATGEEQTLRLQQLIRIDKTWTAVINGQTYQTGDESNDFKVINITDQAVIIQQGKQERRLMLESVAVSITESRSLGSGSRNE